MSMTTATLQVTAMPQLRVARPVSPDTPYARVTMDWTAAPQTPGLLPSCSFVSGTRRPQGGGAPLSLRRMCVVGERHTGTNFLSALLDDNFLLMRPPLQPHPNQRAGRVPPGNVGQGCTSHKHMPQADAMPPPHAHIMEESVAVIIVRNPVDWLAGMCKSPWETNNTGKLPIADCAAAPWLFDNMTFAGGYGHYEDVMLLRRAKYDSWLSMPWPHMVLVNYECLLAGGGDGSRAFMRWLAAEYGLHPSRMQLTPDDPDSRWRLPSRYGLHGFGPYGHGPLSVATLERDSAPALLSAAVAVGATGKRRTQLPPPAPSPPPQICRPGQRDCPHTPAFEYEQLEVARALAHYLPAQMGAEARESEGRLGYDGVLRLANALEA